MAAHPGDPQKLAAEIKKLERTLPEGIQGGCRAQMHEVGLFFCELTMVGTSRSLQ